MLTRTLCLVSLAATAALALPRDAGQDAPSKPAKVAAFAYEGSTITVLPVKDLAAGKAWYAKVLGSTVHFDLSEMGWCELTTPVQGAYIGLSLDPEARDVGASKLSFGVADMAQAKAWLTECKVGIDGDVVEIPNTVKLLDFHDPDGNKLMFYEPWTAPPK